MYRKTFKTALAAMLIFLGGGLAASAQSGEFTSYTPYSIFGVGDISLPGSAYNQSMAGVGIATRNHRYLNTVNPAAVAIRDSLAMMMDVSVYNKNSILSQSYGGNNFTSANNTTNISGLTMSFPIWRKMAMAVGIRPYSGMGYGFTMKETNPEILATNGVVSYADAGQGSIYNVFADLAYAFGKRVSVGVEGDFYFGQLQKDFVQKFSKSSYNDVQDGYELTLHAFSGKLGAQYEQPLGKGRSLTFGATYAFGARLRGYSTFVRESAGSVQTIEIASYSDTLSKSESKVGIAGELGLGVALNVRNRFRAEFNYSRSDWRGTGLSTTRGFSVKDAPQSFETSVRQSFKLGFELIPNPTDVRYYHKRVAYRAGAYYNTEYFTVAGNKIPTVGVTLGATLPVFRWYNGITLSAEYGHRGPFGNSGLVKENFFRICVGVNLFDIWFQKPRYD